MSVKASKLPPEETLMDCSLRFIAYLRNEYTRKYHLSPQFVKIPIWLYEMFKSHRSYISFNPYLKGETVEMVMGCKVCPTVSIKAITEIEVF